MKILRLMILLSFPAYSYGAQKSQLDIKKREMELVAIRRKAIASIHANNGGDEYEAEMILFKKILKETLHQKASFVYPFDSLKEYISIHSSSDGKIRFYTWIPSQGANAYFFENFIQFERKDGSIGLKASGENDPDCDISQVHELAVPGRSHIYITFGWGTHGGGAAYTVVQAWKITNKGLRKVDIIDTTGLYCSHFANLYKSWLTLYSERGYFFKRTNILYDSATQTIFFDYYRLTPGGLETEPELLRTNKRIEMQFNGKAFRRVHC